MCFPKEKHGTANEKNTRSADFCADRIDVMTNFAVITNAVIKRVHCTFGDDVFLDISDAHTRLKFNPTLGYMLQFRPIIIIINIIIIVALTL